MAKNRNLRDRAKGAAQELGGKVQQGVGTLVGDDDLVLDGRAKERAGEALQEDAKTRERLKGTFEEVTGKVKGGVGRLVGDDVTAAEGKAREVKGVARQQANQPDDDE